MKTKKIPKLRFPGFSDDWEVKKLGDLSNKKLSNGVFNDPSKVGNGYRLINVKDMYVDGYIDVTTLTKVAISEGVFSRNKVVSGDIFFTRSSLVKEGIAYTNIYLGDYDDITFDGHLIKMSPDKNTAHSLFIYYLSKTSPIRRQLVAYGNTTTMTTIGQSEVSGVDASLPSLEEQKKIAGFLGVVDEKISALQQKKELLQKYKKGIMQKIFPPVGGQVPEIRFKDENGNNYPAWQEKKLGELGKFKSGVGFSDSEQGGKEGTPFYKVSDMNLPENKQTMTKANNYVSDSQISNNKYSPITSKSILFAKVGAAIFLERKRTAQNYLIDNNMMAFIPDRTLNFKFIRIYFETLRLSKMAQVGALPSYNGSDLAIIKVRPPSSIEEQQKIADFLSSIDEKIESEERKLEQAKQFKKALLQQMFV